MEYITLEADKDIPQAEYEMQQQQEADHPISTQDQDLPIHILETLLQDQEIRLRQKIIQVRLEVEAITQEATALLEAVEALDILEAVRLEVVDIPEVRLAEVALDLAVVAAEVPEVEVEIR